MQDIDNARSNHQIRNMHALAAAGKCLFCPDGLTFAKQQPVFKTKFWYVKPNDYPYDGAQVHIMTVPHRHVLSPTELTTEEIVELYHVVIPRIQTEHNMPGCSGFFRFGDTKFTGATIHHFHMHFVKGVKKPTTGEVKPIFALVGYKP